MNFRFGENTTISRLRVPYSGDALAARLRFTNLLGGMNLHPASLAPSAIVFIKRLQKRHSFARQSSGWMLSEEWRREIISDLSSLVGRAVRPARETVSSETESLFFADETELLACLTSDWLRGNAGQKWWWRSLFRNGEIASVVAALWRTHSESVPAALNLLSGRGDAVRFVEALSENDVRVIWHNITERFALPALSFFSLIEFEERETKKSFSKAQENISVSKKKTSNPYKKIIAAPWQNLSIPRNVLSVEKECLLGIALTIFRAPSIARSKQFAEQTARWLKNEIKHETAKDENNNARNFLQDEKSATEKLIVFVPDDTKKISIEKRQTGKTKIKFDSLQTADTTQSPQHDLKEETLTRKKVKFDANILLKEIESENQNAVSSSPLGQQQKILKAKERTIKRLRKEIVKPRNKQIAVQKKEIEVSILEPEHSSVQEIEARIFTQLGGVFYLINLALFLNLYNDFTNPKEEDLHLNIWDFVYLSGRKLTGENDSQDEIWSLLTSLAGRGSEELPAQNFLPADEWRISPGWLEPFRSSGFWSWSDWGDRLRLWHPSGILALDLPLKRNAKTQLGRETKAFKEFGCLPSKLKYENRTVSRVNFVDGSTQKVSRWLEWLCSYVRARLSLAFGCDEERAANLLCEQRANVFVTPTHIDVVFSLRDLPVEIRLSGLDRNPGWLPSTGKFIAFHYEEG